MDKNELAPGPELDNLILVKIIGYHDFDPVDPDYKKNERLTNCKVCGHFIHRVPEYSTDIGCAWMIVEKLCPDEDEFRLTRFHKKAWSCTFGYFDGQVSESEISAPHAICLAALKTLEKS